MYFANLNNQKRVSEKFMKVPDSERLSYQLMNDNDAELLFQLDQDVEVMRYINGGKITSMQEVKEVYLPRLNSYTNQDKGWGMWKVTVIETGQFIGWVLVRPVDFFSDKPQYDNIELGWRFSRDSWGKGMATEAAKSVKNALIENGDARKLSAFAVEQNLGSINIMKKLGMNYVKTELHKDPLGDLVAVYYELELT